ncbi:AraC family transcriptional regulator [Microbulbifer sp. 2201CG32-9]|uniref:AraC family transcriptional regulator n=1 Tax=Microbulbifer sp. 2201CG32-9 TaxID=3232309 RepID=UPI00345BD322
MDALTDILNTLRMSSSLYFRTNLTAPWGVEVPAKGAVARFHIVIRGNCWLQVGNETEWTPMANGDLVIVPHGTSHRLVNEKTTEARPLDDVLQEVGFTGSGPLVYGGGGAGCTLVCGELAFDALGVHPLLENLPGKLYVSGDTSYNAKWLDSAIGFIGHEAAKLDPGAHAIICRLSEIILIQVIRTYLATSKEIVPFLSAFTSSRIGKVLSAIHAEPAEDWTVERLGQMANMSRSSFSNHFAELVGMSPLQYIIFVRLQLASRLLIETSKPLINIAENIGYRSEAAFSQVFKRQYGIRPGEFRRSHTRIVS